MTIARAFHTATLLSDGRVLITGGDSGSWTSGPMFASAEIYNPTTGTFSATGPMNEREGMAHGHAALRRTRLDDRGRQYQCGPCHSRAVRPEDGRLYSHRLDRKYPRIYQTATLLSDGRVLVAGGGEDYTNGNFLASAELYDPKTGTFSCHRLG